MSNMIKKITTTDFINRARKVHGDRYDYSQTEYVRALDKVIITCREHGDFTQRASNHLDGQNCLKCYKGTSVGGCRKSTTTEFITRVREVHGERYSYEKTDYVGAHDKVTITCREHGDFIQKASNHLDGKGCAKCVIGLKTSKVANRWLDSLGITEEHREVAIKEFPMRLLDAYVAETNTVYQFHGDYWHGNPGKFDWTKTNPHNKKTFGELFEETISWDQQIRNLGYNLVVMWESDFKRQNKEKNAKSSKKVGKNIS